MLNHLILTSMKDIIFQIQIVLRGSKPKIWRRVLIPSDMSLADFHEVIQTSMGWENSHLHYFEKNNTFYTLKIEGDDFSVRRFYSCDENLWFTINNSNKDIYKVMILNDYGDFTREININPKNIPILLSGTNLYFLKYKYTKILPKKYPTIT